MRDWKEEPPLGLVFGLKLEGELELELRFALALEEFKPAVRRNPSSLSPPELGSPSLVPLEPCGLENPEKPVEGY